MKNAALVHLLSLEDKTDYYTIIPGITIYNIEGMPIEQLYINRCEQGLDYYDPIDYKVAVEIDYNIIEYKGSSFFDPKDEGQQMLTVLSICLGTAFGLIRTIMYDDGALDIHDTSVISEYTSQRDFIIGRTIIFNEDMPIIKKTFSNVYSLWQEEKYNSQIINALTYYHFARDIHFIEQTAINLSITLECLFHPHAQHELTHQISYNTSQFIGGTKGEKVSNYKLIKDFYGIRSRIVHNGKNITKNRDIKIIKDVFTLTANILKNILSDSKLINIFSNTDMRKKYLDDLLFP